MSLPGSFTSDSDSGDSIDFDDLQAVTQTDEEEEDSDFSPVLLGEDDEDFIDIDEDDEDEGDTPGPELAEDEQEEPEESGGGALGAEAGQQLRIGYDPSTGAILLIDSEGNPRRLTSQDLRGTTLSLASIRSMLLNRFGRRGGNGVEQDEDEDEEDDDFIDEDEMDEDGDWRGAHKQWYEVIKEPQEAGMNLERSGLFSQIPSKYSSSLTKNWMNPTPTSLSSYFTQRELSLSPTSSSRNKRLLGDMMIPNSSGVEVSQFTSKVYSGQYSNDGTFFYTACQDFCIYIYDTQSPPRVGSKSVTDTTAPSGRTRTGFQYDWQHRTSLKTSKIVRADPSNCRWTITDAELSDDNSWLIYSSISPRSHLVKTGKGHFDSLSGAGSAGEDGSEQETINFASGGAGGRMGGFGIWSLRFSHDTKEIVAGASDGQMFVYDVEMKRTVLRVNAHRDDVNAVAFGSDSDSNLLLSGSDDCFVKVWDRRSLSGERASGVLVGHTEGITWVSPKGDGRYCITNGKDQAMKLWDLRMMTNDEEFEKLRLDRKNFSSGYDYRSGFYPKPRYKEHPHDTSVMTYRGHSVVSTLIRCHWSPLSTTGQRYLYTGSADGKIHIYSLDGRIVETIDRSKTHPLMNRKTGEYNDPSDWNLRSKSNKSKRGGGYGGYGGGVTVRDVSWHPERAELMSTSWEERGSLEGSIAVHQWSGKRGERLEDTVERRAAEASA